MLQELKAYLDYLTLAGFLASLFLLVRFLRNARQSYQLLRRFVFADEPFGWLRALMALFYARLVAKDHILDIAQLRAEHAILKAPRQRPVRLSWSDNEYAAALLRWKKKRNAWRQERAEFASIALEQAKNTRSKPEPIQVAHSDELIQCSDGIMAYFDLLSSNRSRSFHGSVRFRSEVKVEDGFIAPIFLLSGLHHRFHEAWEPIITAYSDHLQRGRLPASQALKELRQFQLNCWLLWGPSIPICSCARWNADTRIALQFGYGDENNSIDLLPPRKVSVEGLDLASQLRGGVMAVPRSACGVVRWGPQLKSNELPVCQRAIRSPRNHRIVLDLGDGPEAIGSAPKKPDRSQYYSAYVWVMFALTDGAEGLPATGEEAAWSGLLPFFEHANIADASTLATHKRLLAAKASAALAGILQDPGNQRIGLRLVSTFDDPLCTSPARFPPPPGEGLREILEAECQALPALQEARRQGRLVIPAGNAEPQGEWGRYSACHLPDMIEQYYEAVARIAEPSPA